MKNPAVLASVVLVALISLAGCTPDSPGTSPSPAASDASPGALSISDVLQLGIASAQAGDVDQARATFLNALALDPGNALANYNLGVLDQQAGNTDAAVGYYDAAIATDPTFTSAMYNKAIILEATDSGAAIELYRTIVSIDDQAATAYFRLAALLRAAGDEDGANDAEQKAFAIDPTLTGATG